MSFCTESTKRQWTLLRKRKARERAPKERRPMSDEERKVALALADYCLSGHRLEPWKWFFVVAMSHRAGRRTHHRQAGQLPSGHGRLVRNLRVDYPTIDAKLPRLT
jgi:hypothetical protein